MKRASGLFQRIADRDNLRIAFIKLHGGNVIATKSEVFAARLEQSLRNLRTDLLADRLELGHSSTFTIYDPKQRTITAPCFRERVLHHAIIEVCEPFFEQFLIDDTFACRVGKGRIAALHRAQQFCGRFKYAIKLDMRKYFESIPRKQLLDRLKRRFKDRQLLSLFGQVIYSHASDSGLPIGSLTSQHFANFYLGWFDRFVKEHLKIRGYVRYMDDCLLWGDERAVLRDFSEASRDFLQREFGLSLHDSLPLFRSRSGIDFLGCRVFANHLKLNRRSRRRYRAKLRDLEQQFVEGEIAEDEFQRRTESLTAFTVAGGVCSWNYRKKVLQQCQVSGLGLEPGEPGRQLEQQREQLSVGES